MAEDKNRLARFGATQGTLAAYNRWGAPVIRPIVQRGRDAMAYARIAGTKELADEMTRVATRQAMNPETRYLFALGKGAVANRFGAAAARGMVSRGFDGVARYGADTGSSVFGPRFVIETPQAGKAATYLSNLHRPPILSGPAAGTRTAKVVDWVGRQGAKVQSAAVKTAGSMSTGITGGVASSAAKGLAKQVFSKAGLAAGFATSGVMDGGEAIWDFARSDGRITDLKAGDWKKVAVAMPSRLGQGLLRGVDGMLFGLPSLIPGYHDLTGDDYMTGEYSRSGSARDNYKKALKLAGGPDTISAADWAKISAKYEREKEDAYMNGRDEDGFAESGVTQDELARRRRDVEGMRARRKTTADWRAAMLYDFDSKAHPEGPDVQSLHNAVMALAGRHEQRMGDLARVYGDNDSFVSAFTETSPDGRRRISSAAGFRDWDSDQGEYVLEGLIRRGDTEGLTALREKKLGFALQHRTKEMDREFSRLQKFRGFDTLVDAVRQEASDVYHRVARTKGYTKDEAAQGFDELWSGMSDFQRASLDTVRFAKMLSANSTEGQEEPK